VWIGGAALAVAALVYVVLLAALRRAEQSVTSSEKAEKMWWLGYARDAINLAAFLAFSGGYLLLGLPGPLALLAGASLTLVGYGLDHLFARLARGPATTGTALIAIVLLSTLFREPLARGLRALLRGLF
jgi:hypothetical protein